MDKNNRRFSVPYNSNFDADSYFHILDKYKPHIENIFVGLEDVIHSHDDSTQMKRKSRWEENYKNNYRFLELTKGVYKRIVPVNAMAYDMTSNELYRTLEKNLFPKIEECEIDGVICSYWLVAKFIKEHFPNIELHSSCNSMQYTVRNLEHWAKIGCDYINPPREAGRMPRLLKEMHDAGFKLKVLVNEACNFGCPMTMNHCINVGINKDFNLNVGCRIGDNKNAIKTNLVLPEWLDYIDEWCDVYKLQGRERYTSMADIVRMMDIYIYNAPYKYIHEITPYGTYNDFFIDGFYIPKDLLPKKLITCECRFCHQGCTECDEAWNKIEEFNERGVY